MEEMNKTNVEKCVHCKICTKNCVFLNKYNIDLSDFAKRDDLGYSCFLCGKCKEVCPKDIDGPMIAKIHRKKHVLKSDKPHSKKLNSILWEKNPYIFSNYRNGSNKSVLFPGCNFPSFFSKTTKKLESVLKKHNIGTVFECCGKPVSELGYEEKATDTLNKMESRLAGMGVEELIMVCPNCYYFMKDKINIKITTIYEKLKEIGEGKIIQIPKLTVYYPCPDRASKEIFEHIKYFVDGEVLDSFNNTQCCGLGGCGFIEEPQLSKDMQKEVLNTGEERLFTYCASCVGNFRRNGFNEAYHLLSMILEVDEAVPLGMGSLLNRMKRKFI